MLSRNEEVEAEFEAIETDIRVIHDDQLNKSEVEDHDETKSIIASSILSTPK